MRRRLCIWASVWSPARLVLVCVPVSVCVCLSPYGSRAGVPVERACGRWNDLLPAHEQGILTWKDGLFPAKYPFSHSEAHGAHGLQHCATERPTSLWPPTRLGRTAPTSGMRNIRRQDSAGLLRRRAGARVWEGRTHLWDAAHDGLQWTESWVCVRGVRQSTGGEGFSSSVEQLRNPQGTYAGDLHECGQLQTLCRGYSEEGAYA